MTDERGRGAGGWWRPLDLVLTGVLAIVALLTAQWPDVFPAAVRVVTAGSLVVFLVGYTLLEVVFPQTELRDDGTAVFLPVERVVLALGLSVVIVPLAALFVEYAPVTLRIEYVVTTVGVFTVGACVAAWVRRRRTRHESSRNAGFSTTVAEGIATWRSASALDRTLDVIVVVSLVFATVTVAYVPLHDTTPEPYTELTLLTENDSGELVADEYPRNMTRDRSYRTCLVVGNHEQQSVQYTIRVMKERVGENTSSGSTAVRTVNRTELELAAGETRVLGFDIRPDVTWDRLVVRYLLYNETHPPEDVRTPYRVVSFPVNVTAGNDDPDSAGPDLNGTCSRLSSTAT